MSTKKILTKDERREAALKTAVQLAKKIGARRVSLAMVAAKHGVTAPLLFHIFESRDGFTKAIVRQAKKDGVTLPEAAPTVREQRAATRGKLKKLPALKKPVKLPAKKLAPPKPLPKSPKLAALLKPNQVKTAGAKLPINVVKAIKNKAAAKVSTPAAAPAPAARTRKPLTEAQRTAKAAADKLRRGTPTTPAGKFAALPKPFEASIAQAA